MIEHAALSYSSSETPYGRGDFRVFLFGQIIFWTSSRHLPPVSAFALACVAALSLASLGANLLLSR